MSESAEATVYEYKELSSTNSQMRHLMKSEPMEELSVVMTHYQTAGRGQAGNGWESERGMNLLMSVLLHPCTIEVHKQFGVSQAVSLAVAEAVRSFGINGVCVKWPNDIYIDDKKVAGILIEHSIMGATLADSVVGIGLNVNQLRFVSNAPNPVSMAQQLGHPIDLFEVFERVMTHLTQQYERLLNGDEHGLTADYHQLMWRADSQLHRFKDDAGEFDASIAGVDDIGRLVLMLPGGDHRAYGFKEVAYMG
ncbi:BirA family biotin operon repressor/biotin-[acetyl-CoA-carboxylase] ligase [Breznakibacter xylanolyticus]|uniref:BirA family biotin operon repressor/biotin-[acetyl-CoA-carboxylase] ligase n=1 Tax=Breznakibacter xylanolyticus TaxID=990 RepID=A0A2W7PQT6_9BACT|nr:biotin--[acetyl-CoA-carboxylase] ligase [Breznakibacter xylanolyticus]PZX11809.1 BirA family biotin operon repressor/biotin-[acetyl-CoA-carboxylase] ligase [Breznakibacter xylanolyticus]